jgi:hypothetical protein
MRGRGWVLLILAILMALMLIFGRFGGCLTGWGPGGGPGNGPGTGSGQPTQPTLPSGTRAAEPVYPAPSDSKVRLRIRWLGPDTKPPNAGNRIFLILDESTPSPLNADEVLRQIERLRRQKPFDYVEFVFDDESLGIEQALEEARRLCSKLAEAGIIFLPQNLEQMIRRRNPS